MRARSPFFPEIGVAPLVRAGAALGLCWLLAPGLSAQEPQAAPPTGTPAAATMDGLSFMAGCWNGSFGGPDSGGVIEEHYTSPSDNVMLGTTRYLRGGRAVQFELTSIVSGDDGIVLTPYPRGRRSEHSFRLTALDGARAVFEAPEHDFPKRIIYRLDGDRLRARIDGGEGSDDGSEWVLERVACPGG